MVYFLKLFNCREYIVRYDFTLPSNIFRHLPKIVKVGWTTNYESYSRYGPPQYNIYLKSDLLSTLRTYFQLPDSVTSLDQAKSILVAHRRANAIQYCASLDDNPIPESVLVTLHSFTKFNLSPVSSSRTEINYTEWIKLFRQDIESHRKNELALIEQRERDNRRQNMIDYCLTLQPPLTEQDLTALTSFKEYNQNPSTAELNNDIWVMSFQIEHEKIRKAIEARVKQQRKEEGDRLLKKWVDARSLDMVHRCSLLEPPLTYDMLRRNPVFKEFIHLCSVVVVDYDEWMKRIQAWDKKSRDMAARCGSMSFKNLRHNAVFQEFMNLNTEVESVDYDEWVKRIQEWYPESFEQVVQVWREVYIEEDSYFQYNDYYAHTGRVLYDDLDRVMHGRQQGFGWTELYNSYIKNYTG